MNVESPALQEAPVQVPPTEVQPIPPSENTPMEANESSEEAARRMFKVDMEQPEETTMIQEFLNNLKGTNYCRCLSSSFLNSTGYNNSWRSYSTREILQKFKLPSSFNEIYSFRCSLFRY